MYSKTKMNRVFSVNHEPDIEKRKSCLTAYELKIWFVKPNSDEPLGGIENELRLINARNMFPKHHIRLIYEPVNLTTIVQEKLNKFSEQYKLELFSLDDLERGLNTSYRHEILNDESFHVQLQLLEIARKECQHEFGNLAAASDIVRTLTPALHVHALGVAHEQAGTRIYTDLDEPLSAQLPDIFALESEELLKTEYNNNFLLACDPENQVLKTVRQLILDNYQVENFPNVFGDAFGYAATTAVQHGKQGEFMWELKEAPYANPLEGTQHKLQTLQEATEVRHYTLEDPFTLRRALLDFMSETTGDEKKFWKSVYLNLVVVMSGPAVYSTHDLRLDSESMVALSDYLQTGGDLSWVPGSPLKANPEEKNKIWNESTLKITRFFKACQQKSAASIDAVADTIPNKLEEAERRCSF
jgi:hypothetical protein